MDTFILTLVVLGLIIVGMSVGVLLGRKPIKGSCGGMASLGMDTACDICGGSTAKCEEENRKAAEKAQAKEELAYEVKSKG